MRPVLSTQHSGQSSALGHGFASPWILFGAFVLMVISFRSIWLRDSVPLWDFPEPFPTIHFYLGGFALPIGMAVLVCVPWLAGRLLENPERPWESGRVGIFLPFLGLSLLLVAGIDPARSARSSSEIPKLLALTWFVYLFVVNERPHLTVPIAFAAAVQGSIAVLQFLTQTDLGLQALGEPRLDTNVDGISILWVQERAWIRSYGLTDHPNWLGAILAVCLMALIPTLATVRGPRRWILAACFAAGFLGMLASFSRAAWLGFSAGLLLHLLLWARAGGRKVPSLDLRLVAASLMVLAFLFLMPNRDLLLSRMISGDNPVEVRSVTDRLRDAELAVRIIESHPWRGVGAGGFLDAAWPLDPKAVTVHNIPLLIAAEFGLPALALWLLLLAGTFLPARAGVPWPVFHGIREKEPRGGHLAPCLDSLPGGRPSGSRTPGRSSCSAARFCSE